MRDEIRGRKIAVFSPYVSGFVYTASGGISQMKLGNGRWETAKFNTRNQVTELGLGASATDASLWKVNYEYGELNPDGTLDPAKNTGNIARQTLTFNGLANPLVQSYRYDSLYRITEAKETSGSAQNWIQNWEYDRYGNRTGFTKNIAGVTSAPNPTIDANTNRFAAGQGFVYDKNGNVVQDVDPVTTQMREFVFNGDNKQTEVRDANGVVIAKYSYDGEGKRVKKEVIATGETTVFVYSSGKLVAEYSNATPPATPQVSYTTTDHLGSPRVITNALGQVTSRRDFLPFGEDITQNVGSRTASIGYGTSDTIRQKFTGYQKDEETSLDFAQARMYANRFGRFTAVDIFGPWAMSEREKLHFYLAPQQWNRFTYVLNNPLRLTDPTGLEVYDSNVSEKQQKIIRKSLENIAKHGDKEQKLVAKWILKNNILISLVGSGSSIDGMAGLQSGNVEALSQRLGKGFLSKEEAASFLELKLNEGKVGDSALAEAALEALLTHEGRHAWVDALSLQSISSDCGKRCWYSISAFKDEELAYKSEASYLLRRAASGSEAHKQIGLGAKGRFSFLSEEQGTLKVNEGKIREILSGPPYNFSKDYRGKDTIQHFKDLGVRIPDRGHKK